MWDQSQHQIIVEICFSGTVCKKRSEEITASTMGEADPGSQRDVWERPTLRDVLKHLCELLPAENVDKDIFVAVVVFQEPLKPACEEHS